MAVRDFRSYEGLKKIVEETAGVELAFHYYQEITVLVDEVRSGRLDGMICKCWSGLTAISPDKRVFERLADITKPDGKETVAGLFLVLKNSKMKTLSDITVDTRLGVGAANAYEKHHLAFSTLKVLGIEKPLKVKEYITCKESALALIENDVDLALVSDYAFDYGCIDTVGTKDDFKSIGSTSETIPFLTFFIDMKLDSCIRNNLKKALLSITGDNIPESLLSGGLIEPIPWTPAELNKK